MYNNIDNKFDLENYSRGNNARAVTIGNLRLWFSYRTVIAFNVLGKDDIGITYKTVGRVNEWGTTTGRHMNDVPGNAKEDRLTSEAFEAIMSELLEDLGL